MADQRERDLTKLLKSLAANPQGEFDMNPDVNVLKQALTKVQEVKYVLHNFENFWEKASGNDMKKIMQQPVCQKKMNLEKLAFDTNISREEFDAELEKYIITQRSRVLNGSAEERMRFIKQIIELSELKNKNDKKKQSEKKPKVYGDINGDGIINWFDLIMLRAILAKNTKVEKEQLRNCDLNGDSIIDESDIALLKVFVLPKVIADNIPEPGKTYYAKNKSRRISLDRKEITIPSVCVRNDTD